MGVVTYNNIGGFGRLGNQMFQIASTIGISLENGLDYGFNPWVCKYTKINFNDYIKKPLKSLNLNNNPIVDISERNFGYSPILLEQSKNYRLHGYFQSEKYFKKHKEHIYNVFELSEDHMKNILEKYKNILTNSCSLHIRRGDYIGLQSRHTLIGLDYYINSLNKIYGDNIGGANLLIFSDDIEWCKKNINIEGANIHFIQGNVSIIDMYLISLCDNNIIANSSFSWWGAWLNKNDSKTVVAPKNWFGPHNSHLPTKDLFCEGWIVL